MTHIDPARRFAVTCRVVDLGVGLVGDWIGASLLDNGSLDGTAGAGGVFCSLAAEISHRRSQGEAAYQGWR